MSSFEIHSRFRTSEYDNGEGPGSLFDEDALEGACRATDKLAGNLTWYSRKAPHFSNEEFWDLLYPRLEVISRKWWADLDFDDSAGAAQIKHEVAKLTAALTKTVELMKERPEYVHRAINQNISQMLIEEGIETNNAFSLILRMNQALLNSANDYSSRIYKKERRSVRNVNACKQLVSLWEWIFDSKFPRNTKLSRSHASDRKSGVEKAFENVAAQFVFDALFAMSRGWVKPGQVQEALLGAFAGK